MQHAVLNNTLHNSVCCVCRHHSHTTTPCAAGPTVNDHTVLSTPNTKRDRIHRLLVWQSHSAPEKQADSVKHSCKVFSGVSTDGKESPWSHAQALSAISGWEVQGLYPKPHQTHPRLFVPKIPAHFQSKPNTEKAKSKQHAITALAMQCLTPAILPYSAIELVPGSSTGTRAAKQANNKGFAYTSDQNGNKSKLPTIASQ